MVTWTKFLIKNAGFSGGPAVCERPHSTPWMVGECRFRADRVWSLTVYIGSRN